MSPNSINLSLKELFDMAYDSDNELARAMARRFEAEFPGNLETVEDDLAAVEDFKAELSSLREEHTALEKELESAHNALTGLQLKVFHISNQEARYFNKHYEFVDNDSEVESYRRIYGPNYKSATAAQVRIWEGGVEEVWLTQDNDYLSNRANFWRVY